MTAVHAALSSEERAIVARRGTLLSRITLAYNAAEGLLSIGAGLLAGSIALTGFGVDSVIEVGSSLAALFRLRHDVNAERREQAERIAMRIVGVSFLLLAAYIAVDAGRALYVREAPEKSIPGLTITVLSVLVMPYLAREKRRVARALDSRALSADATQTSLCAYLSAIVLAGLLLNALFGWWWADPIAGLAMVPIIVKEGLEGIRGQESCADCR